MTASSCTNTFNTRRGHHVGRIALRTHAGLGITLTLALLAGCAAAPSAGPSPADTAGHCYTNRFNKAGVCTSANVPDMRADAVAKRFVSTPDRLTVYVVRRTWGDTRGLVPVSVDGRTLGSLVPDSMLTITLPPGSHELSFRFGGQTVISKIAGQGGEVLMTGIEISAWPWQNTATWAEASQITLQQRALQSRLVGIH